MLQDTSGYFHVIPKRFRSRYLWVVIILLGAGMITGIGLGSYAVHQIRTGNSGGIGPAFGSAGQARVEICHNAGPNKRLTLKVAEAAVQSHISQHGDTLGPCDVAGQGACCIDETCLVTTLALCGGEGGEYLGDDSNCVSDPNICTSVETGSCCVGLNCLLDGVTKIQCQAEYGGEFHPGVGCESNPCLPLGVGACCTEKLCTDSITKPFCDSAGGTHFDQLLCSQIECP